MFIETIKLCVSYLLIQNTPLHIRLFYWLEDCTASMLALA